MLCARNYPFKWVSCGVVFFFFFYSSNETLWHEYAFLSWKSLDSRLSLPTRRRSNVWKSTFERKKGDSFRCFRGDRRETLFTHFPTKFSCCSFKLGFFEGRLIKSRGKLMTGASGSLINACCVENACSCINIGAEKVSLYILKNT